VNLPSHVLETSRGSEAESAIQFCSTTSTVTTPSVTRAGVEAGSIRKPSHEIKTCRSQDGDEQAETTRWGPGAWAWPSQGTCEGWGEGGWAVHILHHIACHALTITRAVAK
jgi:hypothetical protein